MTPGYWYQPAIEQHYLIGCQGLKKKALASGVAPADLRDISGMIIDPRFYDTEPIDRDQLLTSLGLDPSLPTGVISFGSQGTVNVLKSAKRIAEANIPVNLICLCGHNEKLLGVRSGWSLPVREVRASVGAGFILPLTGNIRRMPGLSTTPAAHAIDLDADGNVVGLS